MAELINITEDNFPAFSPMLPRYIVESFMSDGSVLLFGIESEGMAAGVCAVRVTPPQADIMWFSLHSTFRGYGIGAESLMELNMLLRDSYNVSFITMDLSAGSDPKLRRLFAGLPATYSKTDECVFTTTFGAMRSSERIKGKHDHCIPLLELDVHQLAAFCSELKRDGLDYIDMPIDPDDFLKDMSAVYMEDGKPLGMMLFSKKEDTLELPYLVSLSSNNLALMEMISFAKDNSGSIKDDDTLYMNLVDDRLIGLIKAFLFMDKDDNSGFVNNTRITLDLDYLDEAKDNYYSLSPI